MAELEGEVFLLGHWDTFDHLEETLSLPELFQVLHAISQKEERHNKFLAAVNGINLNGKSEENKETISEEEAALFGLGFSQETEV